MVRRVAGSRARRPAPVAPVGVAGLLVCGRIGKPQGLRGEVTLEVRTDVPDERYADGSVLLTDPPERGPLTVASSRWQNGRLVVLFEGVPDRTAAEALRGTLLQVDAATLPAPEDPDVFLDAQLAGLAIELADGTPVGRVSEVLHLPHGDVLAVTREPAGAEPGQGSGPGSGPDEVLVPFVTAIVPVVDLPGGRLVLTPPPGLLDLDAPVDDA